MPLKSAVESNPYANKRVEQAKYYPKGWKIPDVVALKERTSDIFSGIDLTRVDDLAASCDRIASADGISVIPKIAYFGRFFGISDPYGSGYSQIVEHVLYLVSKSGPFYNCCESKLGERCIRLDEEVKTLLRQKEEETPGNVLVLPFNFGSIYAGFAPRNARWEAMHNNQLPLGAAQIGSLLLTMPERLIACENLFIDCPADEYNWDTDGEWSRCTCFSFAGGEVRFATSEAGCTCSISGSVVAFLGV